MNAAWVPVIAPAIAGAIAGVVAWVTSRTAARAQVQSQQVASRSDIEQGAFERAKSYYGDAMDRQNAEIKRQDSEIVELHADLEQTQRKVREVDVENERLKHELSLCKDGVRRLSAIIAARGDE
jgi:predicted nuclease with TOPRIM domain